MIRFCKKNQYKTYLVSNRKKSSNDEKFYTDYFIWQVVHELSATSSIIGTIRVIEIFVAKEVTIKNVDTKYDTTYNISRKYSKCQSGINY